MLSTGFLVFLGVALLIAKLPRRWMLRVLRYDLILDMIVTAVVLAVHWGTFSGVMAATVAGLLTSFATSFAKRLFGYISKGRYVPGFFHVGV